VQGEAPLIEFRSWLEGMAASQEPEGEDPYEFLKCTDEEIDDADPAAQARAAREAYEQKKAAAKIAHKVQSKVTQRECALHSTRPPCIQPCPAFNPLAGQVPCIQPARVHVVGGAW